MYNLHPSGSGDLVNSLINISFADDLYSGRWFKHGNMNEHNEYASSGFIRYLCI
jgi:hypothetical protein